MARARNIKPSFFTNDILAEVPALGRLLFQGLWCVADREGRLVDRPRKLKAEILPYDDCDVEALLCMLAERGFIQRYQADGERFIQVVNFAKHQNPHVKESASSIPAPEKHGTRTVQAPEKPEQAGLIPDSPLLKPESKGSVANATGGKPPMSPDEIIFGYGVPLLVAAGSTDKAARSFLGGLRKHHGDDALINTLRECLKAKPLQPTEWLAAALPPNGRPQARASPAAAREESRRAAGIGIFGNLEDEHGRTGRTFDITPAAALALGSPDIP